MAAYNRISGEYVETENSYVAGESDLTRFYTVLPNLWKLDGASEVMCLSFCLSVSVSRIRTCVTGYILYVLPSSAHVLCLTVDF
jgi:hypothetical protein